MQMGARCYYSAIDVLLKILSPISADLSKKKTTRQQPYCPSLLAHDIEGTFNNTDPALFHQVMQQRSMPSYLCDWTHAFTTNRNYLSPLPSGLNTENHYSVVYLKAHQPPQSFSSSMPM
jgi:hypothetical protein